MAFDAGTVKGKIELDAAQVLASLTRIEKGLDGVAKASTGTESSFKGWGSTLAATAAGIGAAVLSYQGLSAAISKSSEFLSKSIEEARGAV